MDIHKITLVFRRDDEGQAFVRVVLYANDGSVADTETEIDATTITLKLDDRVEVAA